MYPFSCVLWAIFWSFSLPIFLITEAKMPQKLIPNHRTINSKQLLRETKHAKNQETVLCVFAPLRYLINIARKNNKKEKCLYLCQPKNITT